jgi:NAD(P)-dependent dehydrogenase (short-subunit alcohol dehydrogenase family)
MREKPGAYNSWEAYGQSKLANVMSTYHLARALKQSHPQISVNCLHPVSHSFGVLEV